LHSLKAQFQIEKVAPKVWRWADTKAELARLAN
jgi:hypothetical protein